MNSKIKLSNNISFVGAQDGGMWNGRVRVGSAENENWKVASAK